MVFQHGAVGSVRRLLASPTVSDGFVRLWNLSRLDLTVESLVVDTRFARLFTDEERATAARRLEGSRRTAERPA